MSDKRLQSIIERAERVIDERLAVSADLREIFAEAKSAGYDVRTIRAIIRERAMDDAERAEREALLETYRAALGMPGATYRSVAEQLGVSKSKLQRLVPSETRRDMGQTKSSGGMGEAPVAHAGGVSTAPKLTPEAPLDPQTAVSDQPGGGEGTAVPSSPAPAAANPSDDLEIPPFLRRERAA